MTRPSRPGPLAGPAVARGCLFLGPQSCFVGASRPHRSRLQHSKVTSTSTLRHPPLWVHSPPSQQPPPSRHGPQGERSQARTLGLQRSTKRTLPSNGDVRPLHHNGDRGGQDVTRYLARSPKSWAGGQGWACVAPLACSPRRLTRLSACFRCSLEPSCARFNRNQVERGSAVSQPTGNTLGTYSYWRDLELPP